MIQIQIKKQDQITNQASFPTMEEARAWLAHHEGMKSFGEQSIYETIQVCVQEEILGPVQKLVSEATFDDYGNEINPPIYTIEQGVLSPAVYEEQTILVSECEYEVIIEDITAKLEQERVNQESLALLASTDWLIIRELDCGVPCPEEIKQARAEARAKIVR